MNIEQHFKLTNRLVGYLTVVAVFLCSTSLPDQTKCKLHQSHSSPVFVCSGYFAYQAVIFLNVGLAEFWSNFSRKFDFAT